MAAKISVIVPIYNAEKYVGACLKSLTEQSLREIEIIGIDDGSTDKSGEILAKMAKQDKRIRVIRQKNGGRSAARNAGLKIVTTKYVMFCDADDKFKETMCEKMLEAIEDAGADVAVCGLEIKYENHENQRQSDEKYYSVKFRGKNYIDDNIILKTDDSVCNKIFRMDLIQKYKILFPEGLNNEDYYFYNAYMSIAETASFVNQKLYEYIRHEGSIMSEYFDQSVLSSDHLKVAIKLFDFYKQTGFLKDHLNLFWTQFAESYWFSYMHTVKKNRKKIYAIGKEFIDKNYSEWMPKNGKTQSKITMIRHNNLLYKIVRRCKAVVAKLYTKINFAYRQQRAINEELEAIEDEMEVLENRIDKLLKEKRNEN